MKTTKKFRLKALRLAIAAVMSVILLSVVSAASAFAQTKSEKFVEVARTFDNIGPRPNQITDYWGFGHGQLYGVEWCAMMIAPIADKAGVSQCFPRSTWVDSRTETFTFRRWFEDRERFSYSGTYIPKPGDLIIYQSIVNGEGDNLGCHIGIVTDYTDSTGTIESIEGNVNDRSQFCYHHISDKKILGYCRPSFNDDPNVSLTPDSTVQNPPVQNTPPQNNAVSNNSSGVNEFWEVTSSIGAWLRAEPNYGQKIGIVSTGTKIYCDKRSKDWIHFIQVNTENGYLTDGWMHISTIGIVKDTPQPVVTTQAATTKVTTTTTTTATKKTTKKTTTSTKAVTTTTAATVPTVTEPQIPSGTTAAFYVSSTIGSNARSTPDFSKNELYILDTDTVLYADSVVNGFIHAQTPSGDWVYVHTSTVSPLSEKNQYTDGTKETHKVSSDIGCKLRSSGYFFDDNVICILDYDQRITVLTEPNECGFVYCEAKLPGGNVINGYISLSVIQKIN